MTAFEEYMNEIVFSDAETIVRRRQQYAIPRVRYAKEDFEAGYKSGYEKGLLSAAAKTSAIKADKQRDKPAAK